jgi:predicted RNase H-like HicB family nuclease
MRQVAIIVKPDPEDGGFLAIVPGHPQVVGQGETEEAALEDARMALEAGDREAANGVENPEPEGAPRPFDARLAPNGLAADQGVGIADDFDALLGDFWPEDESADEFVSALREWRRDALDA